MFSTPFETIRQGTLQTTEYNRPSRSFALPSKYQLLFFLAIFAGALGCRRGEPVAEVRPESAPVVTPVSLPAPSENDWPWWRGADSTGVAKGPAPTEWSATKNVVWKTAVPGKGHSSPTIWGDRVFVATADEQAEKMSLLCYGRDDGQQRWTCLLHEGGFMHTHNKNTQASATAACDGKHVYWTAMVKNAIWLSAVTLEGQIAWQTEVGPFVSMHGYGSSPVLWQNLVIVQGDSNGPGWLGAVDKVSGKVFWRVQRGSGASFATPLVAEIAGKPQLLLPGQGKVVSYDPATGEKLWDCPGPATVCANTMATSGDLLFASGGYPQRATWAIKADGSGEVVWKKNWKCYVPSMIVDGDRLIVPQDDGIVHCVEAATGKELWSKRLGGDLTSSPVLADGKLYLTTEAGKTFVLRAGPTFEQLAENDLADRCYSTPTLCGGHIFVRTYSQLFCIGENSPDATSAP